MKKNSKKENKISKNRLIISIFVILILIVLGIVVIINVTSFEKRIEKLINSGKNEVLFFDRNDNNSEFIKKLLDNELKEQGIVNYVTINVNDLSTKEEDYLIEKNILSESNDLYLKVINGSKNITSISEDEITKDKIMYYFAKNNLLRDNKSILDDYYYNKGMMAYQIGNLGRTKENLEKCRGYLDSDEILNDRRFLILDSKYEYKLENISYGGRNISITFNYNSGSDYTEDWIFVYFWDCIAPYGCLYSNGSSNSSDARMLSDSRIELRPFQSEDYVDFNNYLNIDIVNENQIKINIEGTVYTLNKTN